MLSIQLNQIRKWIYALAKNNVVRLIWVDTDVLGFWKNKVKIILWENIGVTNLTVENIGVTNLTVENIGVENIGVRIFSTQKCCDRKIIYQKCCDRKMILYA